MIKIKPLHNPPLSLVPFSREYLDEYQENLRKVASGLKCYWSGYQYMSNNRIQDLLGVKFCSYCGIFITATTPVVEHYRPKNRIDVRNNTTQQVTIANYHSYKINSNGYIFHGGDYKNLLIACNACNNGMGYESSFIPDKNKAKHVKKVRLKYGKHNLFPICYKKSSRSAKKNQRKMNAIIENVDGEKPLLLNPYVDDYFDYYDFSDMDYYDSGTRNNVILIKPKSGLSIFKEKKAKTSINIYGLNRVDLCIARAKKYDEVDSIIDDINLSLVQYKSRNNQDNLNKLSFGIRAYLSSIDQFTSGNHEITDFFFNQYHTKLHGELLLLLPSYFSVTTLEETVLAELRAFVHYTLDISRILSSTSSNEIRRQS
ncbi:putative HNH nuclease domain-containing protein [Vibrio crassostreae]|nr:putative HNH nuclease domain-containing protein [Vibrio crassostreae]CAK3697768.1 putative HNH nuclease domain-containing protein [Vibrio crassostreae]